MTDVTLKDWEESLSWNQARLRHTLGHMETHRWEEYKRQWLKMHGARHGEPGSAGSVLGLSKVRTYRTGGETTYTMANSRRSDSPAENKGG